MIVSLSHRSRATRRRLSVCQLGAHLNNDGGGGGVVHPGPALLQRPQSHPADYGPLDSGVIFLRPVDVVGRGQGGGLKAPLTTNSFPVCVVGL